MANLPTPQQKARMILDAFKRAGTRPGEILMTGSFIAEALKKNWRFSDVADGLAEAESQGWIELSSAEKVTLTAKGFGAI